MPRQHTCATICFCVSSGKSKKFSLPCGLPIATDLPLEYLLGPDASALVVLIADGNNGNEGWVWIWLPSVGWSLRKTRELDVCVC